MARRSGMTGKKTPPPVVPKLVLTGPGDDDGGGVSIGDAGTEPEPDDGEDGPTYTTDIDERRRVFGTNVLPTKKTKSLLQLMWLALKDKVLVSGMFIIFLRTASDIRTPV